MQQEMEAAALFYEECTDPSARSHVENWEGMVPHVSDLSGLYASSGMPLIEAANSTDYVQRKFELIHIALAPSQVLEQSPQKSVADALGRNFVCQRCEYQEPMTENELVRCETTWLTVL